MVGDSGPVRARQRGLQYYVTSSLVDGAVAEGPLEPMGEFAAGEVARELHCGVTTSSRTRWSRICWGGSPSK